MVDKELLAAFVGHLEKMVERLRAELAPYQSGKTLVSRNVGGEKIDITPERIEQIKREIAGLQNTIARTKEYWGNRA